MRAPVFAPALAISPEKVCFVALKAREFDVKDAVSDPDSGSNPPTTRCSTCWRIIPTILRSRN